MNSDDIKRTITDIADRMMEGGKQLGTQAQLQVQLRKQQVEYERRIHELGKKSYDWYRAGTMIVSGPVPPEVSALCGELDGVKAKIRETERLIEEAKAQSNPPSTPAVNAAPDSDVNPNQAVIVTANNSATTKLPD
jgi:cob(I)alamin adenosyltransferase